MKKINFNKVLLIIKNNYIINRSIPLILFIVSIILGSIIGAMPVSDVETRYGYMMNGIVGYESYKISMESVYSDLLGFDGVFSIIFIVGAIIIAILSTLSLNAYMRDKSGNDFYHSMSVTRGEMYLANYLTSFINSSITIIVAQMLGLFFMNLMAKYHPLTFGEMLAVQLPVLLSILCFLALFIAIGMIATLGAGTVFAGIVNYIVINFYAPATVLAVALAGTQLFYTPLFDYLQHFPMAYAYTSPLLRYIYSANGYMELKAVDYVIIIAITLAFIALGVWLYTVKKNENSSKPLPFTKYVRPLQYLLTFDAILLGATFFEAITNSFLWCLVGGLLALFFSFIIYNAFAEKSFNTVFKKSRHMLYILLFTILFGAIFVADVFHIYKEATPDLNNVTYAYLNHSTEYIDREEWVGYDFTLDINEHNAGYSTPLDEKNVELITRLYEIMSDFNNIDRGDIKEDVEAKRISVSIGISCKNDYERYHQYANIHNTSPYWNEVTAILDTLKSRNNKTYEDVSYFEVTEEKYE